MNVFSCIFNLSDYKNAYGRYHQVLLEQDELVGDLSQFRISTEDNYIGVSFPAVLFDKYNYNLVNSIIHELTLKWDKMKLDEETIKSRFYDIEMHCSGVQSKPVLFGLEGENLSTTSYYAVRLEQIADRYLIRIYNV